MAGGHYADGCLQSCRVEHSAFGIRLSETAQRRDRVKGGMMVWMVARPLQAAGGEELAGQGEQARWRVGGDRAWVVDVVCRALVATGGARCWEDQHAVEEGGR